MYIRDDGNTDKLIRGRYIDIPLPFQKQNIENTNISLIFRNTEKIKTSKVPEYRK